MTRLTSAPRRRRILPACLAALVLWPGAVFATCRLTATSTPSSPQSDDAARVTPGDRAGVWIWQARSGDELACDEAGFEPIDLWCGEGCDAGEVRIELLPARDVTLRLPSGAESAATGLTVEWRRFGRADEPTELLATRTVPGIAEETRDSSGASSGARHHSIAVAASDDRILRLRIDDDASLSIATRSIYVPRAEPDAAESAVTLAPGPRVPGGEVFGFLELDTPGDDPALLYLDGVSAPASEHQLTLGDFGEFSARGIPPGVYRPRAVFEGGAASLGPELEVVAGETTELIPWRVEVPGPPPGEDSDTTEQADAVAMLTGTVRRADDQPVPDLWVEAVATSEGGVVQLDSDSETGQVTEVPTARTDAAGRFELALPDAGWWQLRFLTESRFPVREQAVELAEGPNEQDFDLGDAAILVRLVRDDGEPLDEPVQVEVRQGREAELVRTGTWSPALGGDASPEAELSLLDLTFDRYQISAFTESGWATLDRAKAQPNKNLPVVQVELTLSRSRRRAIVRLPDGSPATDVLVALDRRQIFAGRPGEYPLTGASQSSEIRVMPGPEHVGVCRVVGEQERVEIDLQPATAEAILIPARSRVPPTGRFLGVLEGLPGSDCPMPIALQWQRFRDEHGRDRILLTGLVPGVYTLRPLGGEPRELVVPGPPTPLGAGTSTESPEPSPKQDGG